MPSGTSGGLGIRLSLEVALEEEIADLGTLDRVDFWSVAASLEKVVAFVCFDTSVAGARETPGLFVDVKKGIALGAVTLLFEVGKRRSCWIGVEISTP
jgi:hypothetical protein